jgi:hypothetical protein
MMKNKSLSRQAKQALILVEIYQGLVNWSTG